MHFYHCNVVADTSIAATADNFHPGFRESTKPCQPMKTRTTEFTTGFIYPACYRIVSALPGDSRLKR